MNAAMYAARILYHFDLPCISCVCGSVRLCLRVCLLPPKKKPGLSHPPDFDDRPKTHREVITPNLARRPPQGPCRTSGDDPPAPVGVVWWLAAVSV
jgi:hypothetical protein